MPENKFSQEGGGENFSEEPTSEGLHSPDTVTNEGAPLDLTGNEEKMVFMPSNDFVEKAMTGKATDNEVNAEVNRLTQEIADSPEVVEEGVVTIKQVLDISSGDSRSPHVSIERLNGLNKN